MSHEIAYDFINEEISQLRCKPYADLVERIGNPEHKDLLTHDGNRYQLEIEVFWNSRKGGDIRVMVCADGGGVSAFVPVCDDFVMTPGGSFVGKSNLL